MPDFEVSVPVLTVSPVYLEAAHPGHRRAGARLLQQGFDESSLTLEFNLYLSTAQISGESNQPQTGGVAIDEIAESDSLDGAANQYSGSCFH